MLSGCQRDYCHNAFCKKNPNFEIKSDVDALRDAMKLYIKYSETEGETVKSIICVPEDQ